MSMRIDLDFQQAFTRTAIEATPDGAIALSFTCRQECVVIHLTEASLDALWLSLTLTLAKRHRDRPPTNGARGGGE